MALSCKPAILRLSSLRIRSVKVTRHKAKYLCFILLQAYVNGWSLTEHKRLVHEGYKRPLKYPCPMCDKVFDVSNVFTFYLRPANCLTPHSKEGGHRRGKYISGDTEVTPKSREQMPHKSMYLPRSGIEPNTSGVASRRTGHASK